MGERREELTASGEVGLVCRAQSGDADSFGGLYELHVDSVYRFVAYRVDGIPEAEDLTELVFLKAWEAMPRYEERGLPFRAWLLRLARNLVIDHYRSRRPVCRLDTLSEGERGEIEASSASAGPDAEVAARHDAEELHAAVRQLCADQQQVVVLRFIEGLSHSEVAAVVGKSEGATRAIQHRALLSLGRMLKIMRGTDGAESTAPDRARTEPARKRFIPERSLASRVNSRPNPGPTPSRRLESTGRA